MRDIPVLILLLIVSIPHALALFARTNFARLKSLPVRAARRLKGAGGIKLFSLFALALLVFIPFLAITGDFVTQPLTLPDTLNITYQEGIAPDFSNMIVEFQTENETYYPPFTLQSYSPYEWAAINTELPHVPFTMRLLAGSTPGNGTNSTEPPPELNSTNGTEPSLNITSNETILPANESLNITESGLNITYPPETNESLNITPWQNLTANESLNLTLNLTSDLNLTLNESQNIAEGQDVLHLAEPLSLELPADIVTKTVGGVTVTMQDLGATISPTEARHKYVFTFPDDAQGSFRISKDDIGATVPVLDVLAYPVNAETAFEKKETKLVPSLQGLKGNGDSPPMQETEASKPMKLYTSAKSQRSLNLNLDKKYIIEIVTPPFVSGSFSWQFGDYTGDPDVSGCGYLNTANGIYNLTSNISINGATCLTVNNTNITVDCLGYSIKGDGTGSTYGILSTQFNTTIRNCNISNFDSAVFLSGDNWTVQNSNLSATAAAGRGLYAQVNNYGTASNIIANSTNGHGIYLFGAGSSRISNSQAITGSASYFGLDLYAASNNVISNVTAFSSAGGAARIEQSSTGNIIANSTFYVTGTPTYFFVFQTSSSNNKVTNCNVSGHGNNEAIYFNSVNNINISNSTINALGAKYGLNYFTGAGSTFINNTFINYSQAGVYIDSGSFGSLFYWNNFTNTSGVYVNDTNGSNFYNTTIAGQPAGNIYFNVISGAVSITGVVSSPFSGLYYGASGSGYPYNNSTSLGKFSCNFANCKDYGPLTATGPLQCGNLSSAGTTYNMSADLTGTGTCFNVTAQNITLNCAGFTITGDNSSNGYGVYSNQINTTVKNCNIRDFYNAIYFNGANYSNISNVNGTNTGADRGCIYLYNGASYNTISNTNCSSTGGYGIRVESSSNSNNLTNFYGSSTTYPQAGVLVWLSVNNTLINITAKGAAGFGIYLYGSNNTTVTNITATVTGANEALRMLSLSTGNRINNGNFTSNSLYAVQAGTSVNNNIIANSTFYSNTSIPLRLVTNCLGNTFANNTFISGNKANDLVSLESGSTGNFFYWNNFTNTSGYYVNDAVGGNYFNTTISSTAAGNIWYNVISGSVNIAGVVSSPFSGLYYGASGSGYPYNSTNSLSKLSDGVTDYGPLTATGPLQCGNLSAAGTTYNMTIGISTNGTCFNVTAANITLDCAGFNITGNNSTGTYGIYSNQYNTTLKNCQISNFQYGVYLNGAIGGNITSVNASANYYAPVCSSLNQTTCASQTGCSDSPAYCTYSGICETFTNYDDCDGSRLGYCVWDEGSSRCFDGGLVDCANYESQPDCASAVEIPSDYCAWVPYSCVGDSSCAAVGTCSAFTLKNSANTSLQSTRSSNGIGLNLINSTRNSISSSAYSGGAAKGVYLQSGSSNNTLTNVTAASNTSYGIYLNTGSSNNITNSTGTSNTSVGVFLDTSSGNIITSSNGTSYGAGNGIYLYSSSGNSIINSNGTSASATGIYTISSSNNNITSSIGTGASNGIYLNTGSGNNIINTNGTSNTGYGIYIYSSSGNSIVNSTGTSNTSAGAFIYGSSNNITNSTFITGGASYGLYMYASIQNRITGCTIAGKDSNYGAWYFQGCQNNIIANSTINGKAGPYALYLQSSPIASSNNQFINNTFLNATNLVYLDASSGNNTFYWNNFTAASGYYVQDLNTGNYYNTTLSGHGEGNIWYNVMNGSVPVGGPNSSVYPGMRYGTNGRGVPYNSTNSFGKISGGTDYAPLTTITQACDNVTTAGSTYTLLANASVPSQTCFNINAANITLDCAGYTITGNNASGTYGVWSNQKNTTVKNCYIQNFSEGIRYFGATDGLMQNNTITTTYGAGNGIRVTSSAHRNSLANNTIANSGANGVYIDGGQNITVACNGFGITGNNASGTYGVYSSQLNTTVKNCQISTFQYGVYYTSALNGTIASNNISITYNAGAAAGIYLTSGSNWTSITGNNVTANSGTGKGILLDSISSSNTINANNASGASNGIHVYGSSNGNLVANNTFSSTGAAGSAAQVGSAGGAQGAITFANNNMTGCIALDVEGGNATVFANNTLTTNGSTASCYAIYFPHAATNGRYINNTLISQSGNNTLLQISAAGAGNNTFYWNNFTSTSGLYANDSNSSNYYNTTVAGLAQGNYWFNVLNGSINIFDANADAWGDYGPAYPYNSTNSQGKLSGTIVDWGPAVITTRLSFVVYTYFNSTPAIYFANGSTVNITTSTSAAPTITIVDPSGSTEVNATAMNGTGGAYYYLYTINGTVGWYNVTLTSLSGSAFSIPQLFYRGNAWLGNFTDASGNAFTSRVPFNATEPNAVTRWAEPIDIPVNTSLGANESSLRILLLQNGTLIEIPLQFYGYNYSQTNGRVVAGRAAFVDAFAKNQAKNYYYAYSYANYGAPIYSGDFSSSNGSTSVFSNMHFQVNTSTALGGTLAAIYSKYSSLELRGSTTPMTSPEAEFSGVVINDPGAAQNTSYSNGTMFAKYHANGSSTPIGVFNFNLTYTFYSRTPYFILETNVTPTLAVGSWDFYRDAYLYLAKAKFDNFTYQNSSGTYSQPLAQSGNGTQLSIQNMSYLAFQSITLRNGVAFIPLSRTATREYNSTAAMNDTASYYTMLNVPYAGSITTADSFYTKNAIMIYDPTSAGIVNDTRTALLNPVSYSIGSADFRNITPPTAAIANYTPQSPNDTNDVTCYSYWNSTIDLYSADVSFNSSAYSANYSLSLNSTAAWVNFTVNSSLLQAGNASCSITVSDVLGQPSTATINFTAADRKAPAFGSITYQPNDTASVDPNVTIAVYANLTEYTGMNNAMLQYSSDGITYTGVPMDLLSSGANWFYYNASFTPVQEANYTIRIFANDTLNNSNTSSGTIIPVFYDWTWARTPATFASVGTQPGNTTSLMSLTIDVTGDEPLSFRVKSNYDIDKIFYDGTPETLQGSPIYSISAGGSRTIEVNATARLTGGIVPITFTITSLNSSAEPISNTTTGTFVSTNESIFLYAEFISPPTSVVQGQTEVHLTAKITNYGLNGTATGTSLTWSLPTGWSTYEQLIITGISDLAPGASYTSDLAHVAISSAAPTGSQAVSAYTTCNENSSYTAETSVTVVSSGPGPTPGPSPSPGGGGGGGGGGSKGGGAAAPVQKIEKALTKEQKSQLFSTLASYELVRGKDSTFDLNITNPLDSDLYNVSIKASGYLYQYLQIDPTLIDRIPAGKSRIVKINIEAPKYFTEGTFTIYFDIAGYAVTQTPDAITTTSLSERRTVELKILSMSRPEAFNTLAEVYQIRSQMQDAGLYHGTIADLVNDAESSYNADKFSQLSLDLQKIRDLRSSAITASNRLHDFKGKLDTAASENIKTPQSERLYSLASSAFDRGDYSNAMLRLNEAELTYALETAQSFSLDAFLAKYWPHILASIAILSIASIIIFVDIRFYMMENELSQLTNEEGIVLGLIKESQSEYFELGKMSMEEYMTSLEQYEIRLGKIVERKVELEALRKNYFNLKGKKARMAAEQSRLEELIRELQTAYLEKGNVETRVYEYRMGSYVARLSEIEEQMAISEAEDVIGKEQSIFRKMRQFGKKPPAPPENTA